MKRKSLAVRLLALLMVAALGVAIYAGIRILNIENIYAEGDRSYAALRAALAESGDTGTDGTPTDDAAPADATSADEAAQALEDDASQDAAAVVIPASGVSVKLLKHSYTDAAAYLYCPDTVISYPVMAPDNYTAYLYHLPDGTRNSCGSLFLDYHNRKDFSDNISVIYGHNMRSGAMFGDLELYKEQEYYDAHPALYLDTGDSAYLLEPVYGAVLPARYWLDLGWPLEENRDKILADFAEKSFFNSAAVVGAEDRFVALSTCSYEYDTARFVLLCKMTPARMEVAA